MRETMVLECSENLESWNDPEAQKVKNLAIAVLENVLDDLFGCTTGASRNSMQKMRGEARAYVLDEAEHPFSFRWICELLDLDHRLLRVEFLRRGGGIRWLMKNGKVSAREMLLRSLALAA